MIVKLIETAYRLLWGDLFTIPFGNSSIGISLMILLLVCMAVMRKLAGRHVEGGL